MTDVIDDGKIGDIYQTSGENPVIHAAPVAPVYVPEPPVMESKEAPAVEANYSLAREPDGAYCIRIGGRRRLSCAEAHQLAIDLTEAADHLGDLRQKQGFDT